jgi:hypothetical protein
MPPATRPPSPDRHRGGLKPPHKSHTAAQDAPATNCPATGNRRHRLARPLGDGLIANQQSVRRDGLCARARFEGYRL